MTQDNNNGQQENNSTGNATDKEREMSNEQKGGQGSKGGADQHGAHGRQSINPNGNLPSGQDGNEQSEATNASANFLKSVR